LEQSLSPLHGSESLNRFCSFEGARIEGLNAVVRELISSWKKPEKGDPVRAFRTIDPEWGRGRFLF
jgi:hypothetical protein